MFLIFLFYCLLEEGFDLVIYSAIKYLNGYFDLVVGAVVGFSRWIKQINVCLMYLGGLFDLYVCFLMHCGLKIFVL